MRPRHLVNLAPGHVSIPAGHHRGYEAHMHEKFLFRLVSENLFLRLLDPLYDLSSFRDFKDIDRSNILSRQN